MLSKRATWALVALFTLAIAACSGGEAAETSTAPAVSTTTTPSPATTLAPVTTTSPPTTTTTDDGLVGDPEALRESFEELERLIAADITYDVPVPIPDLTNPDPVVALAEAFRFEVWLMENGPHSAWAALYNHPDGPRNRSIGTDLGRWGRIDTRFPGIAGTYEFTGGDVVPVEQGSLNDDQLAALPEGSVAVAFVDGGGPYPEINATTGQVLEDIGRWEGTGVAVLSPTPTGWMLFSENRQEEPASG